MNPFWWFAGALVLIAALFVAGPLIRGACSDVARQRRALERALAAGVLDQDEYLRKREDLDRRDASRVDRARPLLALSLSTALLAATLFIYPGPPADGERRAPRHAPADAAIPDLASSASQLAARLEREPKDLAGWVLLGRTYRALERFAESRDALARAHALAPEHPDVMVEYAEALALAAPDRRIGGEAFALIERALRAQPDHPRALWLRGVAHRQAGRLEQAIADWERLLTLLPADSNVPAEIERLIAEARGRTAPPRSETAPSAAGERAVRVLVELDPAMRDRVSPEQTVFVFARLPEGGRAPLAIRRLRVADLPAEVRLDAGDAMIPELSLDRFDRVAVGARVSRSGLAQPESGDLEGIAGPVATNGSDIVRVRIDRVIR